MVYDEENLTEEDDDNEIETHGYQLLDDSGEVRQEKKTLTEEEKDIKEFEPTSGSEIPINELIVMLDNPKTLGLKIGTEITLKLKDEKISAYCGTKKIGDFKELLNEKYLTAHKKHYYNAGVYSLSPLMIKITFNARVKKGFLKLD